MRLLLSALLALLIGCSPRTHSGSAAEPATAASTDSGIPASGQQTGGTDNAGAPAEDPATATSLPAPGTISGKILYPTDATPAMRICAIHDGGDLYGCVHSEAGASSYRIEKLPPTGYRLIANISSGGLPVGGFVKQVQCVGAPCPALLVPINVAPGEDVTGVDLNGFYETRKDFPALPAEGK